MTAARAVIIGVSSVFAIAFVFAQCSRALSADAATVSPQVVTIEHMADADTVRAAPDFCHPVEWCVFTVRVVGIDTPESRNGGGLGGAKCDKELRLGKIAKQWGKDTLLGKKVTITLLPADLQDDPRGRRLGSITLDNGKDYAAEAIRTGNAQAYNPVESGYAKPNWCE